MQIEVARQVAAVVVLDREQAWGGAPVFLARDEQEQQQVAFLIGRIIDGMVHDLENGVLIVVKH